MATQLFLRLSVLQFMQYFLWGAWYVTLGSYILRNMGNDGTQVGVAYGATAIAASLTPFLMGVLADRHIPSQRLLAILHFLGGLMLLGASQMESFGSFYAFFLPYTLLYAPTFSLNAALCFRHLSDPGKQYPSVRVWGSVGWIVAGVLVSAFALEESATPMLISAVVSFVQSLYCLSLPHTPPLGARQPGAAAQKWFNPEIKALFRNRSFSVLVICLALSTIPGAFYYSFVNPYLNDIGVGQAAAKMTLGQVSEMLFMLLLPWFTLRFPLRYILLSGFIAWGARYAMLALGGTALMYGSLALHGVCFIFTALAAQIFIDSMTPPSLKSTVQGFVTFLTMGLGTLIGSHLAGWVVKYFTAGEVRQWEAIWWTPAVLGFVIAVVFGLFFREHAAK
jgi:nucleoside transporter